jgi:hypothetical protein
MHACMHACRAVANTPHVITTGTTAILQLTICKLPRRQICLLQRICSLLTDFARSASRTVGCPLPHTSPSSRGNNFWISSCRTHLVASPVCWQAWQKGVSTQGFEPGSRSGAVSRWHKPACPILSTAGRAHKALSQRQLRNGLLYQLLSDTRPAASSYATGQHKSLS